MTPRRLIEGGDVDPVNTDLIPNYADVFDALKDQPFNTFDGQMYGVPHGRGSNLLMYDPDEVKPAPTSWYVVFDEAERSTAGKVTAYDNPIYIADAALYLREHEPDLGIDGSVRARPGAVRRRDRPAEDSRRSTSASTGPTTRRRSRRSPTATRPSGTTWQVIANLLNADGSKEEIVLPEEGATGWSDTWMISSEAENPNCMYMWMDHIISPEANAAVAEWFGEAPSNEKSCDADRGQERTATSTTQRTRSSSTRSSTGRPPSPTAVTIAATSARPTTSGSRDGTR